MLTYKQKISMQRNWLMYRIRGSLSIFNSNYKILTGEEQLLCSEITEKIQQLIKIWKRRI